jgi:soluble lytic murein transglycosylase-like protein
LLSVALVVVAAVLGRLAIMFAGGDAWRSLLPFALSVVGLVVSAGLLSTGWLRARRLAMSVGEWVPAVVATAMAMGAVWFALQPSFQAQVEGLRSLMGGAAEAERSAIAHQVYAAYRRADTAELLQILERGRVFDPTVHEAAAAFEVDSGVLMGIAATESSFYPRDSKDGGRGLFQITAPPDVAVAAAKKILRAAKLDPLNQRHNAFIAAATLRHYLAQMRGDLFLGLLAYNIGPRNGGLRSIMQQYGARDFVTIQPYLQNLPRDYPIRVLSAALAYRVWHREGALPRYEEGSNARRIQKIGIPGLDRQPAEVPKLAADKSVRR